MVAAQPYEAGIGLEGPVHSICNGQDVSSEKGKAGKEWLQLSHSRQGLDMRRLCTAFAMAKITAVRREKLARNGPCSTAIIGRDPTR